MQNIKLTILAFILFAINAIGQNKESAHIYIFDFDHPLLQIKVAPGTERFTPSMENVKEADSVLLKYLSASEDLKEISKSYETYFRQYVGLIKTGVKFIYVNASCRKPEYYKEDTYYPMGGGKCYFRTLIELKTLQVEEFNYNAPK